MKTVDNVSSRPSRFSIGLAFGGPAAALLILLIAAGTAVAMRMM